MWLSLERPKFFPDYFFENSRHHQFLCFFLGRKTDQNIGDPKLDGCDSPLKSIGSYESFELPFVAPISIYFFLEYLFVKPSIDIVRQDLSAELWPLIRRMREKKNSVVISAAVPDISRSKYLLSIKRKKYLINS